MLASMERRAAEGTAVRATRAQGERPLGDRFNDHVSDDALSFQEPMNRGGVR
jgi:hypothetical protein